MVNVVESTARGWKRDVTLMDSPIFDTLDELGRVATGAAQVTMSLTQKDYELAQKEAIKTAWNFSEVAQKVGGLPTYRISGDLFKQIETSRKGPNFGADWLRQIRRKIAIKEKVGLATDEDIAVGAQLDVDLGIINKYNSLVEKDLMTKDQAFEQIKAVIREYDETPTYDSLIESKSVPARKSTSAKPSAL